MIEILLAILTNCLIYFLLNIYKNFTKSIIIFICKNNLFYFKINNN